MSRNSARNTGATYDDALYWTVDEVGDWLRELGFYEYLEPLQKYNINGKELFELSENRLRKLNPNMPTGTGKTDAASMLWKQITKVKENRRTGKKPKIPFTGWGTDKKQPPKAPEPDYNPSQQYREPSQNDQDSEDDNWDSDFDDDDGPEFDQRGDIPSSQGNTQGRALSYNSSTSSFTNLSSSASGKDDDSSMLYLAPNTDEDCDQTYEVPSEQMNSSYGDGDCDDIYDVPHDEDQNSLQPDMLRRSQLGGRSVSPQPVTSPRHEALRPLPTLPPPVQTPSWPQQQPMEPAARPGQRQMPPTLHRPAHSPHHYPRVSEISTIEDEEQENYEVPRIDQPNYEAPLLETQPEEDDQPEEEYLVPVPDGSSFKSPLNRPPAPLPSSTTGTGMAPPRPAKPPDLTFTSPVPGEEGPPPIPTRPVATRTPIESKGFSIPLPDPPPHVIRDVISRPPEEIKSPARTAAQHMINGSSADENRNFAARPALPGVLAKAPPPLPTNNSRDLRVGQERSESAATGSGSVIANRLKQFNKPADDPESARPQLAPRPQIAKPDPAAKFRGANGSKPALASTRPPWMKPSAHEPTAPSPSPATSKWTAPSSDNEKPAQPIPPLPQASPATLHRPTPRPRLLPETVPEPKPMPSIPTKEPLKIKKFTPHSSKAAQPELPKQEKAQPPPEPEKHQAVPRSPPKQAKPNDMTGYPWYDADMTREEAIRILKQTKMDGAFVVRNSSRGDENVPYSLSLWYNSKVRNLQIRVRGDGKYALGTFKETEQVFDTAVLLIQYHMTNPMILAGDAGKTCLKVAAPNFH